MTNGLYIHMTLDEFRKVIREEIAAELAKGIAVPLQGKEELMTQKEVAAYWGVTPATVISYEKDPKNAFHRVVNKPGGHPRYRRSVVEKYKPSK